MQASVCEGEGGSGSVGVGVVVRLGGKRGWGVASTGVQDFPLVPTGDNPMWRPRRSIPVTAFPS